jgi:hypothetical protein
VLTVHSNGWASSVQHVIFRRKPPSKRLPADRLIEATDQELDALMHKLYDLSDKDIAIVEEPL